MGAEEAAPCRHAGAPPQAVLDKVAILIQRLSEDQTLLQAHGLTSTEYQRALPAAIETLRGSMSASNSEKRRFLASLFEAMRDRGLLSSVMTPTYGEDTVYRLKLPDGTNIAIIQKGCPDGVHSSVRWSAPDWAQETYLWWLCSSLNLEPGEHVSKGVNRLRKRFFSEAPDTLDGVIFHNQICGSPQRPCPKMAKALPIDGTLTPPPCIYSMPQRKAGVNDWNWNGGRELKFPTVLLEFFGIQPSAVPAFVGHVGFQRRAGVLRTTITSRYGLGRSTTDRS